MSRHRHFGLGHLSRRAMSSSAKLTGARLRLSYSAGHAVEVFLKNLFDRFRKAQRAPAQQIAERVVTHIEADFIVFHAGEGMASRVERLARNGGGL